MSCGWRRAASLSLLAAATAGAQTLAHRKPAAGAPTAASASAAAARPGTSSVPPEAEGEYRWGESGEVIELYAEAGQLHGYLTRRSERRDAGSTPITFRFATATADAQELSFTTRTIHGEFYSFHGRLVRGTAATPRQEGYYLLEGALSMHGGRAGADARAVSEAAEPGAGAGTPGSGPADVNTRGVRLPRSASRPASPNSH